MTRPMPNSQVVISDDQAAALIADGIRTANPGHPQEWIDEEIAKAVAQELMERHALRDWSQREYDKAVGSA